MLVLSSQVQVFADRLRFGRGPQLTPSPQLPAYTPTPTHAGSAEAVNRIISQQKTCHSQALSLCRVKYPCTNATTRRFCTISMQICQPKGDFATSSSEV